jgi:hypothetical protein
MTSIHWCSFKPRERHPRDRPSDEEGIAEARQRSSASRIAPPSAGFFFDQKAENNAYRLRLFFGRVIQGANRMKKLAIVTVAALLAGTSLASAQSAGVSGSAGTSANTPAGSAGVNANTNTKAGTNGVSSKDSAGVNANTPAGSAGVNANTNLGVNTGGATNGVGSTLNNTLGK